MEKKNIFIPLYTEKELIFKIFKNVSKMLIFRYFNNFKFNKNIKNYHNILDIFKKNFNNTYYYSYIDFNDELFNSYNSDAICKKKYSKKKIFIKIFLKKSTNTFNFNIIDQLLKKFETYHIIISIDGLNKKIMGTFENKYNIEFFKEIELLTNYFNSNYIPKFEIINNDDDKKIIKNEYNIKFTDIPKNALDSIVKISGAQPDDILIYKTFNETTVYENKYRLVINSVIGDDEEIKAYDN